MIFHISSLSYTPNGSTSDPFQPHGPNPIHRVPDTPHSIHDFEGNRVAEYDFDPVTQVSTLLREYIWMNGLPVAVVENGATFYIRTDHIGRPVFATDGTGTKVWEASYLPFGGVHTSTGANIDLRFPRSRVFGKYAAAAVGQWFQSESRLHQNWMRDYDPTTGSYMQADPLGLVDSASVYGYARQNPGRYTDPRGEDTATVLNWMARDYASRDPTDAFPPKRVMWLCALGFAMTGDFIYQSIAGSDADCDCDDPIVQSTPADPSIGRNGGAASGERKNKHRNKKGGKSSGDKHTKKGAGTRTKARNKPGWHMR